MSKSLNTVRQVAKQSRILFHRVTVYHHRKGPRRGNDRLTWSSSAKKNRGGPRSAPTGGRSEARLDELEHLLYHSNSQRPISSTNTLVSVTIAS